MHEDESSPSRESATVQILAILAFFALALLPTAAHFVAHYPDERHYTDAAIGMLESGDWIVPLTPQGDLRLRKPILAYWVVAASYRFCGIGVLAARLPFLLMSLLMLWLTYRLVRLAGGSRDAGLIAVAILAANAVFMMNAARSLPEPLLCLLLLTSALGFVGFAVKKHASPWDPWLAYLGAGLAFAAKGFPAAVWLVAAFTFFAFNPWRKAAWDRLLHLPAMLAGFVAAGSWFLAVYLRVGPAVWDRFFSDQVLDRGPDAWWEPAANLPLSFAMLAALLLPWLWPLLAAVLRGEAVSALNKPGQRMLVGLSVLWCLLLGLLIGLTGKVAFRYWLLASPLISAGMGLLLAAAEPEKVRTGLRVNAWVVGGLVLAALIGGAAVQVQLDSSVAIWVLVGAVAVTGVGCGIGTLSEKPAAVAASLAGLVLLLAPASFVVMAPFALPDQGEQIAATIVRQGWADGRTIQYVGKPALASKARIFAAGKVKIRWSDNSPPFGPVLIPRTDAEAEALDTFGAVPASTGYQDLKPLPLLSAACQGRLGAFLNENKQEILLVPDIRLARRPRTLR